MILSVLASVMFILGTGSDALGRGDDPSPTQYEVQFEILDGERVIGKPRTVVTAGETAIITMNREGGYSMRIDARQDGNKADRVQVTSEIYLAYGGVWTKVAQPAITANLGATATYELAGASRRDRATGDPLVVRMVAAERPVDLSARGNGGQEIKACSAVNEQGWRNLMSAPVTIVPVQYTPPGVGEDGNC